MKLATSHLAATSVANKHEHNRKTLSNWVSHILLLLDTASVGQVAALVRSHMTGLIPFD